MPTISRPNLQTTISQASLSGNQAGTGLVSAGQTVSAAGQALQENRVGQMQEQIGQMVAAEGRKYFEESKRAHQTGQLSNMMSEATTQFIQEQQARYQQVTDKDGNPTFQKLPDDIKSIGDRIANDLSAKTNDTEVVRRFKNDFGNYVTNQQIQALKTARNQQIDFSRASLNTGLGTILQQGVNDDIDNLGSYGAQARQLLDDSLQGGVISAQDHARMIDDFNATLTTSALKHAIKNNTAQAAALLDQNASTLGITDTEKADLTDILKAKVGSDEVQIQKAEQLMQQDSANKKAILASKLETAIQADVLREDELLEKKDQLEPKTFTALKKKFLSKQTKVSKERQRMLEISDAIAAQGSLDGFSSKDINTHYSRLVEAAEQTTGGQLSLQDRSELAVVYNQPVSGFAKELNASLLSGDVNRAAEAMSAYTFVRDKNNSALDGRLFTNKAQAIAEMSETLIEKAGMEPSQAITQARETILNTDEGLQDIRSKQFRKLDDFKADNIEQTALTELGLDPLFGFEKGISDDAVRTYQELTRLAYLQTGDEDVAKEIAKSQMDKSYGISSVNGDDEYMLAPPEKLFPNLPIESIRTQLLDDTKDLVTEGQTPKLVADDRTLGVVIPSYAVVVSREIDGVEYDLPLVNPNTGELVRFVPDAKKIQQQLESEQATRQAEELEQAKNIRQQMKDLQGTPKAL